MSMTNAEKQAAHRARKAAELDELRAQLARLQGSGSSKADQITAAVEVLSALAERLITATATETADETAASYAAAAEIVRAKHSATAALKIIRDNEAESDALEAHMQAIAARERPAR